MWRFVHARGWGCERARALSHVSAWNNLAVGVPVRWWKQQVNIVTPPAAAPRRMAAISCLSGPPLPVSACRSFQRRRGSLESFHRSCKSVEIPARNSLRQESVDHNEMGEKQAASFFGREGAWLQSGTEPGDTQQSAVVCRSVLSQLDIVSTCRGKRAKNWKHYCFCFFCFFFCLLLIGWLNIK